MKKFVVIMSVVTVILLAGCGNDNNESKGTIGISMPSLSLERWERDGNNIADNLQELGFETDLQFGQDDVQTQISQIENMITKGVDILIIAAIDGEALTEVAELANDQGIEIIAYDRLIMNTEHISYYVTFDNFLVGETQGRYIVDKLGLEDGEGPFNIEIFAGAPDDNNANFFFDGAISVLQPYIDAGTIKVGSGQTEFNQVAIQAWATATAQTRMDNLLSAHYTDDVVHAVLSPNDSIAMGIVSSLENIGYGTSDRPMPIITGQDADLASVKSILEGGQTQTVFKDTRRLAETAASMVVALLEGEEVQVNNTDTYNNHVKVVPTYLVGIESLDIENIKDVLIESGFYTEVDLGS